MVPCLLTVVITVTMGEKPRELTMRIHKDPASPTSLCIPKPVMWQCFLKDTKTKLKSMAR